MSDKNKLLATSLFVLITGKFATVLIYFAQLYHVKSATQLTSYVPTVIAMFAVFFFVDTTLAVTLVLLLYHRRSGFRKSDALLKRIMIYAISTGLVSGAWALVGLFTAIFLPTDFAYLLVSLVMPKRKYRFCHV